MPLSSYLYFSSYLRYHFHLSPGLLQLYSLLSQILSHCKHYPIKAKRPLLKPKSVHLTSEFWTLQRLPLPLKDTQTPYLRPRAVSDPAHPWTLSHVPLSKLDLLNLAPVTPHPTEASTHAVPSVGNFLPQTHPLAIFCQKSQRGLPCHLSRISWTSAPYLLPSLDVSQFMIFQFFALLLDWICFYNRMYTPWEQGPGQPCLFLYPWCWALTGAPRNCWMNMCWHSADQQWVNIGVEVTGHLDLAPDSITCLKKNAIDRDEG